MSPRRLWRTHGRAVRAVVCGVLCCMAALAGGCSDGWKPGWLNKNRRAAEARWNRVRSDVRMAMAEDELNKGHYEEAAAQLATAELQTPDVAGADLLKAKILMGRGDFFAAESVLRVAVDADPHSAEAHYLLGVALQHRKRPAEAIEHYQTACALEPTNSEYALAVAECFLSDGNAQAAVDWLEQLQRAPGGLESMPAYHLLLGEALRLYGDAGRAAVAYENAIHLGSEDIHTLATASAVHMNLRDYWRAAELLEPIVAAQEKEEEQEVSPSMVMALARCYLETGRAAKARVRLGVLVRTYEDPWAWLMLSEASADCGEIRAAINNAKRAIALDGDNSLAHQILAGLALRAEDYELAFEAAEQAVQLNPTDALNYCLLADIARREGDRKRAIRLYEHGLELDPECEAARSALRMLEPLAAADSRQF
ncbi:MAG: tetratricopeptide repeat protein [Phycisphaerales bacterium]|nr:MAG: tetratricopeptide repeat protein [Phycisphaerales bacterium]